MTREIIPINSLEQLRDLKTEDVMDYQIPCLFDLSPSLTVFELYHAKKNSLFVPSKRSDRHRKHKKIEDYAAQEVCDEMGWDLTYLSEYVRIIDERLGTEIKFEINCPTRGKGLLMIKPVEYYYHCDNWVDGEATADVEITLQAQLEIADRYQWGCIAAFTGIYDFTTYIRDRDTEMGANLRLAGRKFWADVKTGKEPKPDFYRDSSVIEAMYRKSTDAGDLDKTGDDEFEALLARFERFKAEEKRAQDDKEATKTEIHTILGTASGAFSDRYRITAGWTKDSDGTLITSEMVGTRIGARKGYRQALCKNLTTLKKAK